MAKDAPNLSLVVADEQTAGRGRLGRPWYTPPGASLAFSLVLHTTLLGSISSPRFTGLGALAVCTALYDAYNVEAQIKWPNDVLVGERKLAGILVEASWQGDELLATILGIGINVALKSVPPEDDLSFPATCVEAVLGVPLNRWKLLREVLEAFFAWLPFLDKAIFIQTWEEKLAFHGEWVHLILEGQKPIEARLLGLEADGAIHVALPNGSEERFQTGEVHLRSVDKA